MLILSGSVQINSFVYDIDPDFKIGYFSLPSIFHKVRSNHHRFQLSIQLAYHPIYDILDALFFCPWLFLPYKFRISWKDLHVVMAKYHFNIYITSDILMSNSTEYYIKIIVEILILWCEFYRNRWMLKVNNKKKRVKRKK